MMSTKTVHEFSPGDFLIFQLESGFGLLRVLDVTEIDGEPVWHLAAYRDLFLDVEMAEQAIANPAKLQVELPHVAITNRAFESTQVSKLGSLPLAAKETKPLEEWATERDGHVSDRSIRLLLGLR